MKRSFWYTLALLLAAAPWVMAQELVPDADTQLLLHFNNNVMGAAGELPALSQGVTYAPGRFGSGALLGSGDRLTYSASGNISATAGTVEGWFKPEWNGNDGQGRLILTWGAGGGMLLGKDGADNLRIILNRYGLGGQAEIGVAINVGHWVANEWHHVAYTYDASAMRLYVDGSLATEGAVTINLPNIAATTFQVGGEGTGSSLGAVVDEFRISNTVRSAQEIADTYTRGLVLLSLTADPASIDMYPTWTRTPGLSAETDMGPRPIPAILAQWSSSAPGVADVSPEGLVTAISGGTATVTATLQGFTAPVAVTVTEPLLPPMAETLDPFLTTPAAGYIYEMPVVIISYLPTADGVYLDANLADWGNPLDDMRADIATKNIRVKYSLEEGSRFRGFDNPDAPPSLGYRVVEHITVFEPLPRGPGGPDSYQPDYRQILERFGAEHWVNDLGVKEIWIWGYHHGDIYPVESNMSSPTTGDISNSWRLDDLPVYDHTFVLYNYNFTRSQAEAVHNHGHQLESILSHVDWQQNGNSDFLWQRFSGRDTNNQEIMGRCGNTHIPPNTLEHYDYLNPNTVQSDIRAWTPAGGPTTAVNYHTWGDHPYDWPYDEWDFGQREESQWYIFWMQSMPGFANTIPWSSTTLNNWWVFTADWDAAINAGLGLYGVTRPFTPGLSVQAAGTDMVLTWDPAGNTPGSVSYLVFRADAPTGPWLHVGSSTGTGYTDPGAALARPKAFYRVQSSVPPIVGNP